MNNTNFNFKVEHKSTECLGRTGVISTRRGEIPTPIFMPVGTAGTVKTLSPDEIHGSGASIILGNTYHLYLRPGTEVLDHFGGLHNMMKWNKPMLTDSGGFQVFSLKKLNKITDEGVEFTSHIDGSKHWLTPEVSMSIQRSIGAEIMMAFDECCPYPADDKTARAAMERSVKWAIQCRKNHPPMRNGQALFGIVQGAMSIPMRLESIKRTSEIGFEGLAIGGLSVGEPKDIMLDVLDQIMPEMPTNVPRYLMGVGTPEDLFYGVERGIDMFDCVHPTRIARHATVFSRSGRVNLLNASWKMSDEPIEKTCNCYACKTFSRGYLRHLFKAKEILGMRMASLHNITFMINLISDIRKNLSKNTFTNFKNEFFSNYLKKGDRNNG